MENGGAPPPLVENSREYTTIMTNTSLILLSQNPESPKIWARYEKSEPDMENLSQIWKIWARYEIFPYLAQIFFLFGSGFSYLAQISEPDMRFLRIWLRFFICCHRTWCNLDNYWLSTREILSYLAHIFSRCEPLAIGLRPRRQWLISSKNISQVR